MRLGLRSHPERLASVLSAVSWAWILSHSARAQRFTCCQPHPSSSEEMSAWMLMVGAMMVPTTFLSLENISLRSYRARRLRAVAAYLLGYVSCWLALGVAVVAARLLPVAHNPRAAPLLCAIAACWYVLPRRERWHRMCHRQIVLRPVGWDADWDALRQGAVNGAPCVAMCWPLMVACALTDHNLVMMVGGTALVFYEKRMFRLRRLPLFVGAIALAGWTLTL